MRFTKEVHRIVHRRLRELQRGALPIHSTNGICADINSTLQIGNNMPCGYDYCNRIIVRLTGDTSGYPIGYERPRWVGKVGKDRRAFAGFMADFIEHTYLGDKA